VVVEFDGRHVEKPCPLRLIAEAVSSARSASSSRTKRSIASESPSSTSVPRAHSESLFPSGGRVYCLDRPSPQRHPTMTSQGTAHGRFRRAIASRNLLNVGNGREGRSAGLSLADALALCELFAATEPKRHERAALGGCSGSSTSGYRLSLRLRLQRQRSLSCDTVGERLARGPKADHPPVSRSLLLLELLDVFAHDRVPVVRQDNRLDVGDLVTRHDRECVFLGVERTKVVG
jgi:hypothetical protein